MAAAQEPNVRAKLSVNAFPETDNVKREPEVKAASPTVPTLAKENSASASSLQTDTQQQQQQQRRRPHTPEPEPDASHQSKPPASAQSVGLATQSIAQNPALQAAAHAHAQANAQAQAQAQALWPNLFYGFPQMLPSPQMPLAGLPPNLLSAYNSSLSPLNIAAALQLQQQQQQQQQQKQHQSPEPPTPKHPLDDPPIPPAKRAKAALPNPIPPADPPFQTRMTPALLAINPDLASHPMWSAAFVGTNYAATAATAPEPEQSECDEPVSPRHVPHTGENGAQAGAAVEALLGTASMENLSDTQLDALKVLCPQLFAANTPQGFAPTKPPPPLPQDPDPLLLQRRLLTDPSLPNTLPHHPQCPHHPRIPPALRAHMTVAATTARPPCVSCAIDRQRQLLAAQASISAGAAAPPRPYGIAAQAARFNSTAGLGLGPGLGLGLPPTGGPFSAGVTNPFSPPSAAAAAYKTPAGTRAATAEPPPPPLVKHIIIDILDTILETTPFDLIARRQCLAPAKVRAIFEAIVQVPMLRYPDDKRKVSKFAINKLREYHEAKKKAVAMDGSETDGSAGRSAFAVAKFMGESGPRDYPAGVPSWSL